MIDALNFQMNYVKIDVNWNQCFFIANGDHGDVIQSVSWKRDGKLLATSCKDKCVRIVDPRSPTSLVSSATSHQSIKDSRIVWLGEQDRILTTGKVKIHSICCVIICYDFYVYVYFFKYRL